MELVVMCDPISSVTSDLDNEIVLGKSNILREHTNSWVRTICVKDNLIISCSCYDKTINIWDRDDTSNTSTNKYDYKCVQVLTGLTDYVMSICIKDNLIISCSSYGEIRIWDVDDSSTNKYDYKCMQILKGHTSWINTICVKDNLIISGSNDKKIRIWDLTNASVNKYDYRPD